MLSILKLAGVQVWRNAACAWGTVKSLIRLDSASSNSCALGAAGDGCMLEDEADKASFLDNQVFFTPCICEGSEGAGN